MLFKLRLATRVVLKHDASIFVAKERLTVFTRFCGAAKPLSVMDELIGFAQRDF
ncbi:hypothetical protein KCP76_22050 [Salmonella enterica subsp. enterica serovar Weltevreden]|nr:hypothetical protein KCP76_22050 [Salmonella enterica subsp. enterica serovar Weltevreden]